MNQLFKSLSQKMTNQQVNLNFQNKQMFFGDMTSKMAHDE